MAKLSELRIDTKKTSEGVWYQDPWGCDLWFKIASIHNPAFVRAMRAVQRMKRPDEGDASDGEEEAIARAAAEHLLLDVRGLEDDETGEAVKYTPELGISWARDPQMQHVMVWVTNKAQSLGDYLSKSKDDAGKP